MTDEKLREEIALTPVSTHKYNGKRYLTLDGIDRIQALFTTRLEEQAKEIKMGLENEPLTSIREKIKVIGITPGRSG